MGLKRRRTTMGQLSNPIQVPLVTAFGAERYSAELVLSDVIAPPYDVISPAERDVLERRHPCNIVHLILPQAREPEASPYAQAARTLAQWRAERVFRRDDGAGAYVLRQRFRTPDGVRHERTGVIGAIAVEPFASGRVKPHERTHAGPKEDRLALLQATHSMFEALFLLSRDEGQRLGRLLKAAASAPPTAEAELLGVEVVIWRVTGPMADELLQAASASPLYIADGHHRYETAIAFRSEYPAADRVPGLVVPVDDPGLVVLATHRLVQGEPINVSALVEDLRRRFQIRELAASTNYAEELGRLRSRGTAAVLVLPAGRALALLLKGGASLGDLPFANEPAVSALDVARVDEIVVKHAVALAGDGAHVTYVADAGAAIDAVRERGAAAAVLVNPTAMDQVLTVADAGSAMPPKATYFTPKVPSGLVIMDYA